MSLRSKSESSIKESREMSEAEMLIRGQTDKNRGEQTGLCEKE